MAVELWRDEEDAPGGDKGTFGWRITADNGEPLAHGEKYVNADDRDHALEIIFIELLEKYVDSYEGIGWVAGRLADVILEGRVTK